MPVAHGEFRAGAVGELAGVTGNTIGQWARWGVYPRVAVGRRPARVLGRGRGRGGDGARVAGAWDLSPAGAARDRAARPLRRLAAERGAARHDRERPAPADRAARA